GRSRGSVTSAGARRVRGVPFEQSAACDGTTKKPLSWFCAGILRGSSSLRIFVVPALVFTLAHGYQCVSEPSGRLYAFVGRARSNEMTPVSALYAVARRLQQSAERAATRTATGAYT